MAKAIYEKRQFKNRNSGETINYDFYGIVGIVDGERMELALKDLNGAEKIAFKLVASGGDPDPVEDLLIDTRKSNDDERKEFNAGIKKKTILDDDDEEGGLFS